MCLYRCDGVPREDGAERGARWGDPIQLSSSFDVGGQLRDVKVKVWGFSVFFLGKSLTHRPRQGSFEASPTATAKGTVKRIGIEQRSTSPRIEVGAAGADKNNKTIYSVTGQARSRTQGRIRSK
jgi:hypothetical protein